VDLGKAACPIAVTVAGETPRIHWSDNPKEWDGNVLVIYNARVITPRGILDCGVVRIEDGRITSVSADGLRGAPCPAIDAQGRYLAPGFIDIHVHGGAGADFSDGTMEAYETITQFYPSRGVTALQVTPAALPLDETIEILKLTRRWMHEDIRGGSIVLGVHLEGPFLNIEQSGAQPPENVGAPLPAQVEHLLRYDDVITEMTLAPELPGALALIRDLKRRGILVAAGHSQAREKDVLAAIEAGLSHTSHIYSSMSTVVREGPWRIPGLLETTLVYDELTTEMIADGRHLPPTLMRLVYKCKGPDRLSLVSDAMRGAGRAEGEVFEFAGQTVIVEDGVAMLPSRAAFAGSVTPLDTAVRNVIEMLGVSVPDAVRLVTRNPAELLGIQGQKGAIEPGMDADLTIFDDEINIETTIIAGEVVHTRSG
jgi:N-acetylglucosamine-6-phosphate deacetylase